MKAVSQASIFCIFIYFFLSHTLSSLSNIVLDFPPLLPLIFDFLIFFIASPPSLPSTLLCTGVFFFLSSSYLSSFFFLTLSLQRLSTHLTFFNRDGDKNSRGEEREREREKKKIKNKKKQQLPVTASVTGKNLRHRDEIEERDEANAGIKRKRRRRRETGGNEQEMAEKRNSRLSKPLL